MVAKKPGPLCVSTAEPIDQGTNCRHVSPTPKPTGTAPTLGKIKIPNTTAHYDVRPGDSLWLIARNKLGDGGFVNDLAKLNRLSLNATLQIGQRLIVPDYQRYDLTVNYMVSEMLNNANSPEAKAIFDAIMRSKQFKKLSNEASEDIKKAKWYELFRIYGDQEVLNSMMKQSGVAMAEAMARWFLQVRQNGPWDHKPILKKMYESMPTPPRPFGSMGRAYHFPIRGDIYNEYYYDIWSNIHYGYVGTKCGFDEITLQNGAASGFPGAGSNDESDIISVNIGIELWKKSGLGLKADDVRCAIISRSASYVDARNREISRGMNAEDATNVVITDNDYK